LQDTIIGREEEVIKEASLSFYLLDAMTTFVEEYGRIIGLVVLSFVIIFLFSTPSMILAKSVTTIDTELSHASDSAMFVRAKMDFGNNEHLRTFPTDIGDWKSVFSSFSSLLSLAERCDLHAISHTAGNYFLSSN
jgi:hypothetical protein